MWPDVVLLVVQSEVDELFLGPLHQNIPSVHVTMLKLQGLCGQKVQLTLNTCISLGYDVKANLLCNSQWECDLSQDAESLVKWVVL